MSPVTLHVYHNDGLSVITDATVEKNGTHFADQGREIDNIFEHLVTQRNSIVSGIAATTATGSSWDPFRDAMPVTKRWVYFDHAAVAPLPQPTAAAMASWCRAASEEGDTAWPDWNQDVQETRQLAATMIGADPSEVAFVASTTAGINLVAEGYPWKAGDNVVTIANEFPLNAYPWMNLAGRGVETRRVAVGTHGRVQLDDVLAACDSRTKIVSVSWVGFSTGARLPLAEFSEAIHRRGALFFLDAIQGLGVFDIDVSQIPIDFLAADGHKWMLGPEGAGIFYLRKAHLDLLRPTGVGWNSVEHCYDFSKICLSLKPSAGRFEGGTLNMAGFLGLGASLRLLAQHGLTAQQSPIGQRILHLTDYACEQLQSMGATVVSPREGSNRSGIVSFQCDGQALISLRKRCLAAGIVLSVRNDCLRISPHAYNSTDDIDHLIDVLRN